MTHFDDRSPARRPLTVVADCDRRDGERTASSRGVALAETCFVVGHELHGEGQGDSARDQQSSLQ